MIEHLPECPISIGDMSVMVDGVASTVVYYCSCASLRLCEERVEESMDRAWTHTLRLKQLEAFANGLDAAEAAVNEVLERTPNVWNGEYITVSKYAFGDLIAAIRALKEKP